MVFTLKFSAIYLHLDKDSLVGLYGYKPLVGTLYVPVFANTWTTVTLTKIHQRKLSHTSGCDPEVTSGDFAKCSEKHFRETIFASGVDGKNGAQ